ncbi:LLM class flavin-dependent oxidoreductase [Paenibacillus xylaniclasticus]|uniref:LLM class flavin-dependent oxidoreductase n=1 Tax=Paenibacillus xylaniclasticus TaxID=588083 RepID=UPI000FDB777D|nr:MULTISPECIES: LLM class flavin-dependent oxidoreductase [Paenibacillus]GFN31429.1 alkanesulfonate monooxygenase [Paenibacillus curdlanolyticus]
MIEFLTMLPTHGDSAYVGAANPEPGRTDPWTAIADREPSLAYAIQYAQAAERNGFTALLLPTGNSCLDSLVTASALASSTETLKLLIAARPGFTAPATFARQIGTLDYYTQGRALVNIITGGNPAELNADGDFLDHASRYRRTAEFIHVLKRLFTEDRFTHEGEFYHLKDAALFYKSVQQPRPTIYFGGASSEAIEAAAKEADVYMLWAETLELTKERIDEVKAAAAAYNRELGYSISFQVYLGDTEEEAWANARSRIQYVPDHVYEAKAKLTARNESFGEKRLQQLMESSRHNGFQIGPNLWAGLTQALGGNSIALVGTPDQVADRILEYADLGFEKFLLRGYPFLETVEAVGRELIPSVRKKLAERESVKAARLA